MVPVRPESARPDELHDALRLLFGHLPPAECDLRVGNFLWLIQTGEVDSNGVFVLREQGQPIGALLVVLLSGATGILWPPVCLPGPLQMLREDALMEHGCAWLRERGARLTQALLSAEEAERAEALERNGVRRITSLLSLRHDLELPADWLSLPARLTFESYDPDNPVLFHQTLESTYEGTLDCPELSGSRSIDKVIEGHRGQGTFDPDLWWLAREQGRPVGVVLLIPSPDGPDWELAYLGLVPAARRRGLGKDLVLEALCAARAAGAGSVRLAVDARNDPARRLYRQAGFALCDSRVVYLAVWR
jgi:ribosomal protein S18 acetylase RimI-like enzyme